MTIEGCHYHLDKTILGHVEDKDQVKLNKMNDKRINTELEYLKYCYKADIDKYKNPSMNVKNWTNTNDIKAFLQPLKCNGETWPKTNRQNMEQLYI